MPTGPGTAHSAAILDRTVQRPNPWLILLVTGIGSMVSALLGSSVTVVLPLMQVEYQVELSAIEWVVTGYLLTTSSLLIFFGRLGDILGHKQVYTVGFGLFTVGSLICGYAPSIGYLITGRIVQAIGASMLFAISAALVTQAFPAAKRGQALGLQAAAVYVGLTVGPMFGGFVAEWLGWQWIFLILTPIGAACCLMAAYLLPKAVPTRRQSTDPVGAILFALALSSLLAVLSKGGSWGWSSFPITGLTALALAAASLFIWVEKQVSFPMVPFVMFRNPVFSSGIGAALTSYAATFVLSFLMIFYMIEFRGFSPQEAGLLVSAQALTMVAVAPCSGWLSDRIGSRGLTALGMAIQGLALILVTSLAADAPQWEIYLIQATMGLGAGLFSTPNNSAIMGAAAGGRQGVAAGLLAAARNTGMVIGIAVGSAIFRGLQTHYHATGMDASQSFLKAMNGALYTGAGVAFVGVVLLLIWGSNARASQPV